MGSVGIDIIEIGDFKRRLRRSKKMIDRLFTQNEKNYCERKGIMHLASRFAAKEALAKASGINNLKWQELEVINLPSGKPIFKLSGDAKKSLRGKHIDISISNTKSSAVAVVIII